MFNKLFQNPSNQVMFDGPSLIRLILPFIAGFVMSLLVGMLDTAMVSTVGESAVSGVSLVDSAMQMMIFVFLAFATGGAVVAGQYLGNNDRNQACSSIEQLIFLAALVSSAAMLLVFLFRKPMITVFFGSITTEVNQEAQIYLLITLFSLPGIALYEACMASFRAMGEAKITMYVSLVMNLVNVLGNALLIFIFHLGTAGVAWPTLISRWMGAFIGLILLLDNRRPLHLRKNSPLALRSDLILKILKVGIPNGIENGIFQLGKIMVLRLIAMYGTQAIAANAVAVILTNILSVPGWGINQANMTVISRCVGAEEYDQARYYNRILVIISSAVIAIWGLIIIISLPLILPIFHLSAEAVSLTRGMILIHAIGSILFWSLSFMTPTAMRAAGDATFAMIISILSMWIFRVGLAWILCRITSFGALNIWLAMDADWVFRAIIFSLRWKNGKWMTKRII